jgi:hypothetical protein
VKQVAVQDMIYFGNASLKTFCIGDRCKRESIGAVLMQGNRLIACLSKSLGIKSQDLSTYEEEFIALQNIKLSCMTLQSIKITHVPQNKRSYQLYLKL